MADRNDNPFDAEDTGHVWDENLRELKNPPPRWWMIGLHASWIFVVIYGLLYPMWPLASTHTKGLLGWTSVGEMKQDIAALDAVRGPFEQKLATLGTEDIVKDASLRQYAEASAKVLFADKCAACHGAGGQGNPSFPVLADDDWLYGGTLAQIEQTIRLGRRGIMPAHGAQLSPQELDDVARHVVALSTGQAHAPGKAVYDQKGCFACHGPNGEGNVLLGAARLNDRIWRFAGPDPLVEARATIAHGVNFPGNPQTRNAVMPAFGDKLTDADVRKLAIYVHGLGGGQ